MERHRVRLFGPDSTLTLYAIKPEEGDTELGEIATGWRARRVWRITDDGGKERGAWQFEILSAVLTVEDDDEPIEMKTVTAVTVSEQRWKVFAVEEPVGVSGVWKLKAERQK